MLSIYSQKLIHTILVARCKRAGTDYRHVTYIERERERESGAFHMRPHQRTNISFPGLKMWTQAVALLICAAATAATAAFLTRTQLSNR